MTSPDGAIPGGAVNYGSLADFAAKTELDWNVEIKEGHLSTWGEGGLLGHLFQDLARGKPLVIAILGSLADALGLGGVWDTVESVVSAIAGFLNRAFEELWQFILDIPIIGDIVEFVGDILAQVVDMLVTLFTNPGQAVAELWNAFKVFIDNLWDGIVDTFVLLFTNPGELLDRLGDAWRGFLNYLGDEFDDVWAAILDVPIVGDIMGWIGEATNDLIDELVLLFTNPGAALQKLADAWRSVTDWIVAELDDIWEWLKDVPILGDVLQFIEDALDEVFGWFRSLAKALGLDKLWDGIEGVVSDIGGFISDIGGAVWAGLNGAVTWVGKVVNSGLDAVFNAVARLFGKVDTTDRNAAQMMAALSTPGVGGLWQVVSSTDEGSFPRTMVNAASAVESIGLECATRIVVRSDRTINAVRIALAEAPRMNQFFVRVMRLDPAGVVVNGTRFHAGVVIADLGDQKALLGTDAGVKTFLLPKRISVSGGDTILVCVRQVGGTATRLHCSTANAFPGLVLTQAVGGLASTGIPDQVGDRWVLTLNRSNLVWCAVADVDESKPLPRSYADNFNRVGANTLGPAWLPRRGQLGVREWDFGWFTPKRTSVVPLSGSSVSTQIARMASPDHEVFGVPYSTASGASSLSYLQGRFDGLGNGVAAMLGWWSGRYNVEIRQCTNDYDPRNGVVRASAQVTDYMDFTMFKLMCDGTRYSIWYVNRSGVAKEACYWDDLGKLLPYTNANTEVGIGAYQTGMHSAIDDWAAKDLTPTTT